MKVVIVCDWLTNMGGGEKVIEEISKAFNNPPIYTSVVNKEKLSSYLASCDIRPSKLQGNHDKILDHKKYFPFMPMTFKKMEIEPCDVLISSSSSCAKMVKVPEGAIHICYCHTPMRYAWVMEKEYLQTLPAWKRPLARILLSYMRRQDLKTSKNVDYFIANSQCVKNRIKKYYHRDATVIYPNVDISKFPFSNVNEDYYVVTSRLVYYKRIDLAVKACSELNKKLIIIGAGPELNNLKKVAGPTIKFLGRVSDEELIKYVSNSKAFLFPGEEDFGIAPIEAMATGKPVMAFARGGALETVVDGKTGIYFYKQDVYSLKEAILKFENAKFDHEFISKHASQFASNVFDDKIKQFVNDCYLKRIHK